MNRSGRCTLRIQNAEATPTSTSTTKRSTRNANQPCDPSHGSVSPFATAPISAITIVGNSTRKPQKMKRVDQAGAEALEQLLLAEHDDRLVAHALRHVVEPLHRLAEPDEAGEQERAAAEERAGDAEDDEEGEGGDRGAHDATRLAELARRVAGFSRSSRSLRAASAAPPRSPARTSCRSPTTA